MVYAYLRVSTKEQNLERQIIAVKEYRPELVEENIYTDKQSGKNFQRDGYEKLKAVLRHGDELIIKELDRLGRNKKIAAAPSPAKVRITGTEEAVSSSSTP